MEKIQLNVHHIHCGGCENRLQTVLGRQAGVQAARASQRTQTVDVEFDPQRASPEQIRKAIERAGFEVRGEPTA